MKVNVILNKDSGTYAAAGNEFTEENIKKAFSNSGIESELFNIKGSDIIETVKSKMSNSPDAIIAAGGDGSVSSLANALEGTDVPLGVLPAGTLNHFAKDLNIPLELKPAVEVIARKKVIKIDTGEVNGKIFINNSSIGFYPKVVKKRIQNQRLGGSKWIAMGSAIVNVFKRFPLVDINLESDQGKNDFKTSFVFIGNNEYKMDLLNLGSRERINKGYLSLYYPDSHLKLSLFKFAFLALINKLHQQEDFCVTLTKKVKINIPKHKVEVALDGEVHHLTPPLEYKIRPESLNVIVP